MSQPAFLTQVEIDALVAKTTGRPRRQPFSPPQPPPAATASPDVANERAVATHVAPAPVTTELARMIDRLARLETAVDATQRATGMSVAESFELLADELARLTHQVEYLLQRPWAYRLRETFTCRSCEATQYVAERIKCTQCGDETWWGWFPKPDAG